MKIQQNNTRPHVSPNYPSFVEASQDTGLDTRLVFHPPNSPNINVLDLVLFKYIQFLQHTNAPSNIYDMVTVVKESFQKVQSNKLNNTFFTLQKFMEVCIIREGNNYYKLPHIINTKLDRGVLLPVPIRCSRQLLDSIWEK